MSILPADETNVEWKLWHCVQLEKCNKCNAVKFSGRRAASRKNVVFNKECDSKCGKGCRSGCQEVLRTVPMFVNGRWRLFGDDVELEGSIPQPTETKMCTECGQTDFGHELITVKIKRGELNYALNSFPRNENVIGHSLIVCSCCSSVGFPGCNSQLTRIKDEHLFFVDGDDVEGIDREISEWEIDHTPDCKGAGCYDISILLTRDELEYAFHAMGKSSTCFNLVQKSRNLVDGYQTCIAMSNNELLMKLRRCKDVQEIRQYMERLLVLLSCNEAFLNHPEGTFPMLVLSEVESFIVMVKELRQRIGMENWDRSTARAFGSLLKKAKSLRKKQPSRKSKVVLKSMDETVRETCMTFQIDSVKTIQPPTTQSSLLRCRSSSS